MTKHDTCLECSGTGYVVLKDDSPVKCDYCGGSGRDLERVAEDIDVLSRLAVTPRQFDTGASGDTHDFLNQMVNDVVEGR